MDDKPKSVRGPLFVVVVFVAVSVGLWALLQAKHTAHRQARMNAIREGKLPLDPTDDFLTPEQYDPLRAELAAQKRER